ncbi:MAG: NADH-quinone oxidoreductase subunit L [Candidatus Omnitrophica bacterium]|nr:NADH-quinone oxidoreductase subunit L [Candidatus Omnitrophota bacterium]
MITTCWLILFLPLGAALLSALFKSKPRLAGWISTLTLFACFLLSVSLLLQFPVLKEFHPHVMESSINWMNLSNLRLEIGIYLDGVSLLMLLIVTGVGTLIFLYSTAYMEHEEGYGRYFASLSLFAFSMLGIVLANNLIQIFIFWELVGLSSYLLIGFWFHKPEASTAAKKAFLTTRVGDVGMMIGILMLFGFLASAGHATFNFTQVRDSLASAAIPPVWMTAIGVLIFLGVAGKSAQMPLHVWLPDAMEGPTPVSALIHAATMVAAGVFLLVRLFFLFSASAQTLQMIAWTGIITAFIPATIAFVQNDIKKILAYSTLSQLGYMVMALGLGSPEAGMFHLATHAFFKALLFLGSGSLIHAMHTQDIFEMGREGGLIKKMPVTSLTFLIGTIALMGIPMTSGFFSKEAILATAADGHPILFYMAMITVFFTAFYMSRLCVVVFLPGGGKHGHAHESPWPMTVPLMILAVLSLIGGYLPIKELLPHAEHIEHGPHWLAAASLGMIAAGFVLAFIILGTPSVGTGFKTEKKSTKTNPVPTEGVPHFLRFLPENKYFFDDFYDWLIRTVQQNLAKISDAFERNVVVEAGINGTARLTRDFGDLLRRLQTGVVQFYALVFSLGVTVLVYLLILAGKI